MPKQTRLNPFLQPAWAALALLAVLWSAAGAATGGVIDDLRIVALEGIVTPVGEVVELAAPVSDAAGNVGFSGVLDNGGDDDTFLWIGAGPVWRNSDELSRTLSGGLGPVGISQTGGFLYSPTVDGLDSVWSHNGLVALESEPAPGFPEGTVTTFHNRPSMTSGGTAYWVSGFNESGGGATEGRALYRAIDANPGSIEIVLRADDVIDGFAIARGAGIDLDYSISDDGQHHVQPLSMVTGSPHDDEFLYVDGTLVAREGDPTGSGDLWQSFDLVAVNDQGTYLASGDTDGASSSDAFLLVDGTIVVREGEMLAGLELTSPGAVQALALNNQNHAAFAWSIADAGESLFHTCDAGDLSAAVELLSTGDRLDSDGDGTPDTLIRELHGGAGGGPSIALSDDGVLHVEAEVDLGDGPRDAMLEIETPGCHQMTAQLIGDCPGTVTLRVIDGTAGGLVQLLLAADLGNEPVSEGNCTGILTRLSGYIWVATLALDVTGRLELSPTAPDSICGGHVQLVDVTTCGVSNVVTLPE